METVFCCQENFDNLGSDISFASGIMAGVYLCNRESNKSGLTFIPTTLSIAYQLLKNPEQWYLPLAVYGIAIPIGFISGEVTKSIFNKPEFKPQD